MTCCTLPDMQMLNTQENINANMGMANLSIPGASQLGTSASHTRDSHPTAASQPAGGSFASGLALLQELAHGRVVGKSARLTTMAHTTQLPTGMQLPEAPPHRSKAAAAASSGHRKLTQSADRKSTSLLDTAMTTRLGSAAQPRNVPGSYSVAHGNGIHIAQTSTGACTVRSSSNLNPAVALQLPASPMRPVHQPHTDSTAAAAQPAGANSFAADFLNSAMLHDRPPQLDSLLRAQADSATAQLSQGFPLATAWPVGAIGAPATHVQLPGGHTSATEHTEPPHTFADDGAVQMQQVGQAAGRRMRAASSSCDNAVLFPLPQSSFSRYALSAVYISLCNICKIGKSTHPWGAQPLTPSSILNSCQLELTRHCMSHRQVVTRLRLQAWRLVLCSCGT